MPIWRKRGGEFFRVDYALLEETLCVGLARIGLRGLYNAEIQLDRSERALAIIYRDQWVFTDGSGALVDHPGPTTIGWDAVTAKLPKPIRGPFWFMWSGSPATALHSLMQLPDHAGEDGLRAAFEFEPRTLAPGTQEGY